MLKLRIKPKAENDLSTIFEYTAMNWSVEQADSYQDDLFAGMKLITTQEHIGSEYPYAEKSYRKLQVNRHLIFYRIENKTCIIIRILHDRMDIKQHLP